MTSPRTEPAFDPTGDDLVLSLDAFVRSLRNRQTIAHSIFLGAGASISSGIPSAEMCIWEWKRSIFLTNNPGIEDQFTQLSLPAVRHRIQKWLDVQGGFPPGGTPHEYTFYIQQCFPIPDDRHAYFKSKIRDARPHVGYQLLCHLAQAQLISSVWSTNFDGLVARAAAPFSLTPIEVGLDSQQRLSRSRTPGELLCVSLHGDYRYDELKNTAEELQAQEATLRKALIDEVRTTPLVVVGYSGRDRSIMDALRAAYTEPGTGTLFWCGYGDDGPPNRVADLIRHGRAHGRNAYYVPSFGFDDLMTRLSLYCLVGERRQEARRCIATLSDHDSLHREPFRVPRVSNAALIKSNAFPIECPGEVFQFDLKVWPTERVWASLRDACVGRSLVAVPLRKVLALGAIDDIHAAFGDNVKGAIERTPIASDELRYEDGAVVSLLRQALVRSIADNVGLRTDGVASLWRSRILRTVRRGDTNYFVHDAATVFLRRIDGNQYLILKPSLMVFDSDGAEPPSEIVNPIKVEILGYQHNGPFNQAVNSWRATLFPKGRRPVFAFPPNSGSTFEFRVRRSPIFASVGRSTRGAASRMSSATLALVKHHGLQLDEPRLLFTNRAGTGRMRDTHPIRGMLTNRPYDFPLTAQGLSSSLRIGVICPAEEARSLYAYLQRSQGVLKPSHTERDYLLDYPGFQTAYGLPIEVPSPDSAGWKSCPEPSARDRFRGALEAARLLNGQIEALRASHAPDVVLIYIPDRWQHFRGYRTESESFDLHDFVKASCVQRGIATQFLNQDTLADKCQCRVWWWLSLALYVKGMRTPWLLDNLADDTAFVGLGYSIDSNAPRGDHVVLGCSHIYSERGEGLQYRLSKIEDPVIRGRNPFMSEDDARRVGDTIRQLFFDSRKKLPERVVLHKRAPFVKAEREGLRDGLSGVRCIDMLEIGIDHALRYIASVQTSNGKPDEDNFPVQRGTALALDDYSALLWVHGATAALNPRRKYYQGKRRIPAPLFVKRHAGRTPLAELAREILGLSKMNWNTFDLYTKLPATLESSGEIAKIGSLLQRFGGVSYDYRLFI